MQNKSRANMDGMFQHRYPRHIASYNMSKNHFSCLVRRSLSAPAMITHDKQIRCLKPAHTTSSELSVVTWNIAAPNSNPFEFWATHGDSNYNLLMATVHKCLEHPEEQDVQVSDVFTESMFQEFRKEIISNGLSNLDSLDQAWTSDLKSRKIISEFLKDTSFGEKRLISMPDRISSSIKTSTGKELFRPSPITASLEPIDNVAMWWSLWKKYMFATAPVVRGKLKESVFALLEPIPRTKYPALSDEEEAISIPLQALCMAIFDAIFTHLLQVVASSTWQPLKRSLCKQLYENKAASCVAVLTTHYANADIIFIQEADEAFAARAGVCLSHEVLRPAGADGRRAQMSLVLARRGFFADGSARDVSEEAVRRVDPHCVERGDLCAVEVAASDGGAKYLLASFHGDSAGRSTAPALAALDALHADVFPGHILVVGLDANTSAAAGRLGHDDMSALLAGRGLASCWSGRNLAELWTTFSARTSLQPQLHKAVGPGRVLDPCHRQLKDWILFRDSQVPARRRGSAARVPTQPSIRLRRAPTQVPARLRVPDLAPSSSARPVCNDTAFPLATS